MINPNDSESEIHQLDSHELSELMLTCTDNKLTTTTYKQKRKSNKNHIVIEVSGMPKSFKSTLILSGVVNLRTKNITSQKIRERPININKREQPLRYTIAISNNAIHRLWRDVNKQLVTFVDRGVYDRLAFLYAYHKLGVFKKKEVEMVANMLINIYADEIDGVIICNSKPNSTLLREGKRKKPGVILNKVFLTLLDEAYRKLPYMILDKRKSTKFKDKPLFLSQLDSDDDWETYSDNFIKSVGSICNLYNLTTTN